MGPADIEPALLQCSDCWLDYVLVFAANIAVFTGVRVQPGDGNTRIRQTKILFKLASSNRAAVTIDCFEMLSATVFTGIWIVSGTTRNTSLASIIIGPP